MAAKSQRLGPFHLRDVLGEGGQSVVWLADDVRSGNVVALKVLRPGVASSSSRARLKRELDLLATISAPGIPRGIEYFEDAATETVALSMEYVRGTTLDRFVPPVHPEAVLTIGRSLLATLEAVHARGVVHRDIKPANIILRPGWDEGAAAGVVLVDFGIALGTETHATRHTAPGGVAGTVAFIAPELLFAGGPETVLPRVDIFSLGVVLWSMLTGAHPTGLPMSAPIAQLAVAYHAGGAAVVGRGDFERVEAIAPGLLACLEKFVSSAPGGRLQSASLASEALGKVMTLVRPNSALPQSTSPSSPGVAGPKVGSFTDLPAELRAPFAGVSVPRPRQESLPARATDSQMAGFTALPEAARVSYEYVENAQARSGLVHPGSSAGPNGSRVPTIRWILPAVAVTLVATTVAGLALFFGRESKTTDASKHAHASQYEKDEPKKSKDLKDSDEDPEPGKKKEKSKEQPVTSVPKAKVIDASWGQWATVSGGRFVPGSTGAWVAKEVVVKTFDMAIYEVTQAEFDEYLKDAGKEPSGQCWERKGGNGSDATWLFPHDGTRHPVVCVTAYDARSYADWRSERTGRTIRLPTAAEWEWAARAAGLARKFVWGDVWPPAGGEAGNIGDVSAKPLKYRKGELQPLLSYNDGFVYSSPVGSFRANPLGIHDLSGNVYEWTSSCSISGTSWDSGNSQKVHLTAEATRFVKCDSRYTATGIRLVREK